ncbi:unnamed protein product, partial [Iphiclides podalirius]
MDTDCERKACGGRGGAASAIGPNSANARAPPRLKRRRAARPAASTPTPICKLNVIKIIIRNSEVAAIHLSL